jgi:DNA replication protein
MALNSAYVQPSEFVHVPSALFGPLLARIEDLQELRCALRVIFLLHRKQGTLKYVSTAELVEDPVLQCGEDIGIVERALDAFVRYGLLVKVPTDAEQSECYCLDTPANRRAVERVSKGELRAPAVPSARAREKATAPRPDIFALYEDNIGAIYPMAADRLKDMETEYSEEWIADAFQEAVLQNSRNLKYIEAILRRWRDDGRGTREPGGRTGTVSASEIFRRAGR